jgi:Tfp pilus assembly protein PilF
VVSDDVREESLGWLPQLADDLVLKLAPLFPNADAEGRSVVKVPSMIGEENILVSTVRTSEGQPLVVRELRRRGDSWELRGQVLDPSVSPEVHLQIEDCGLTRLVAETTSKFRSVHVELADYREWRPTVLLPARQTETFEGRSEQLNDLVDWLNDTDSRACNLYGDGGIGKTTLVLELLNRLLENEPVDITWKPDVICFFSAKLTRWGPDGLIFLRGIEPSIDEAVRTLAAVYEVPSGKEWYSSSGKQLIGRVETLLQGLGIKRTQVLLILDNTETMARSFSDEKVLAEAIEYITKRLARVLITSRRRERMEARPIEVPRLSHEEGVSLIVRLAERYGAAAVLQTGDAGRRKLVEDLKGHPIKIDACCRLVGRFGHGLDRAKQQVLGNSDLSSFLYDDAWARISQEQRLAVVSLAQMGESLSGELIQFICAELSVDQGQVVAALEETKFATRFDYATEFDVRLEADALSFLQAAHEKLGSSERTIVSKAVAEASRRRAELLRAHSASDNVIFTEAFRTDAARAAYQASERGTVEDATFWFEEAVRVDSSNGALLERFAYFLASKARDLDRAKRIAEEACRLNESHAAAFYTAGYVAASQGGTSHADEMLEAAEKLGYASHLCKLQQIRARLTEVEDASNKSSDPPVNVTRSLYQARRLLADVTLPSLGDERDRKHDYDVKQATRKLQTLERLHRVVAPRTVADSRR